MSHGYAKYMLLVYIVVSQHIYIVHYFLFKHGTWRSHRPTEGPEGGKRIGILDFVGDAQRNCACRALGALASMLLDPEGEGSIYLRLMALTLGTKICERPLRVQRALQVSLLISFCVMWRKLYLFYKGYPWALAPAFDKTRSLAQRLQTLEEFFDAPDCCLDKGLCRALRHRFPDITDYVDDTKLAQFLRSLFEVLVPTSTQVELQFSKLSALTHTRSKRVSLSGLSAKSMNHTLKANVARWRLQHELTRATSRKRPQWTKTRNPDFNCSYMAVYRKDVGHHMRKCGHLLGIPSKDVMAVITKEATKRWHALSPEVQQK